MTLAPAKWASKFTPAEAWGAPREAADVAAEGVQALMSGQVVIVPGLPNKITAAWAQVTPHWLTRYVTGLATRRTDWLKKP